VGRQRGGAGRLGLIALSVGGDTLVSPVSFGVGHVLLNATVAPFALLVPFVGALSSSLVFGERFGPLRLAGMALVVAGLAVIILAGRSPSAILTRQS
jgi:O-acetylserine/cysteine efflux transporter